MPRLRRATRRLVLRPLTASDYGVWREGRLSLGPRKNPWDLAPRGAKNATRAAFRKTLAANAERRKAGVHYALGVFEKSSGALVGGASVMDVVRGVTHSAYLGYWIHNAHWGKGYGKEAVRALIDVAFRDLKLHRVEAGVQPYNRRSILLARALGLRKEGLKKRMVFLDGAWRDLVMYSATCDEFGFKPPLG